ncbi:MAG: hypothetical protein Q8O19_06330 [Rectinemataceae bacterium]|nr:hypothetical protein [Rectinemataceae bacterium]
MTNSEKKICTAKIFQLMDEKAKKYGGRLPAEAFETKEELYSFFQALHDELIEITAPKKVRSRRLKKKG